MQTKHKAQVTATPTPYAYVVKPNPVVDAIFTGVFYLLGGFIIAWVIYRRVRTLLGFRTVVVKERGRQYLMITNKTHIKCNASLLRVDATGCNDCDVCGGKPSPDTPVLQLRIERVVRRTRGRSFLNEGVMVSLHRDCVTRWFDYFETELPGKLLGGRPSVAPKQ